MGAAAIPALGGLLELGGALAPLAVQTGGLYAGMSLANLKPKVPYLDTLVNEATAKTLGSAKSGPEIPVFPNTTMNATGYNEALANLGFPHKPVNRLDLLKVQLGPERSKQWIDNYSPDVIKNLQNTKIQYEDNDPGTIAERQLNEYITGKSISMRRRAFTTRRGY